MEVKAGSMCSVVVNSHHRNTFHLSACLQQGGVATTIAPGYTYKWPYGVPFDHSSAQTNCVSSMRMEHLCQSLQTRLQHHQKCSEKYVVLASQPIVFAQHVPASKSGYHAAYMANAEDNVRTTALLPINANNESTRQRKRISLNMNNVDLKHWRAKRKLIIVLYASYGSHFWCLLGCFALCSTCCLCFMQHNIVNGMDLWNVWYENDDNHRFRT